jgi:putative FmdB family regulatory protein
VPTYGYHCPKCQTEFEVVQRMTDPAKASCPRCGAPARRLFFPAGIVFKGSGFYKTDSRRSTTASVNGAGGSNGTKAPTEGKPAGEGAKSEAGEKAAGTVETSTGGGGASASGSPTST